MTIDGPIRQNYIGLMSPSSLTVEDILGPGGLLARSLNGFEFRPSQLQMALQIQASIQKEIPAVIEAGTGTGKTFGYLVPIILSGKKAVISTGTKNLQEQIYFKDLPLLEKAVRFKVDALLMKGRKNYLCLHKYHQYAARPTFFETEPPDFMKQLDDWVKSTASGDRLELTWLADDDPVWDLLSSTSEQCMGPNCMFQEDCFLNRLRSRAVRSRIIIVNHHLFFADLKVKKSGFGEIIPRSQVVLFDEAHTVEEIGTAYLGESFSTGQVMDLAGDLEKMTNGLPKTVRAGLKKDLKQVRAATEQLKAIFENRETKGRLDQKTLSILRDGPVREVARGLRKIRETAGQDETPLPDHSDPGGTAAGAELHLLAARAEELGYLLDRVLHKEGVNWLNWYEMRKKVLLLHASPLDISEAMTDLLYQKVRTVAFTSATLSTNGNFDYIRSRLNLPGESLEGNYPSHFDFKTRTLMYIPKDLPGPADTDFGSEIARRIADIVTRTKGRALVLFTSYRNLNLVWHMLKDQVPYTIHRQGDAPRSVLLDNFREDVHSILLGTASFWQGVDVPGESLSCLIVDKLPFDSPGDPLVAARIDAIREQGGNPFMEYQLPSAIIVLKQGLGRLIRKSSDRGILSILDKRILNTRYGRIFLNSLPEMPVTHALSDISRFFQGTERSD